MAFTEEPVNVGEARHTTERMKLNAVIFDLFGTLVDDFASSIGSTNPNLAMALEVPSEPFAQIWRQTTEMRVNGTFQTVEASLEHVCDAIGVRVSPQKMKKAVEMRLQQIRRALKPKPDAIATLTQLRGSGYKIGLLSNCSIEIPILWPETPLAALFDSAIFSSRERLKKPDPRIYSLACDRLGVRPENCLYIADGENYELATAAQVGLHPVLIRNHLSKHRPKLFREAEEWKGDSISVLSEVLLFVGV
jgi:putative hydrolase of the HAD superfamily